VESGVNQSQQHTTVCPGKRFRARACARACARTAREFNRGAMAGWYSPRWRPRQLAHHAHDITLHCSRRRAPLTAASKVANTWLLARGRFSSARGYTVCCHPCCVPPASTLDGACVPRPRRRAACGCDPGPARATPISDFLLDWLYPWMIAMRYCCNGLPHVVSTTGQLCARIHTTTCTPTRYHTSQVHPASTHGQPRSYTPCAPRF
jgi:hypothetical protein